MGTFVVQQQFEDFIENQGQLCQLSVGTPIIDQLPVETASLGEMRTTDVVVEKIEQFYEENSPSTRAYTNNGLPR